LPSSGRTSAVVDRRIRPDPRSCRRGRCPQPGDQRQDIKEAVADRLLRLRARLRDKSIEREITDFCRRGTELGRSRALRRLRRRFDCAATYEIAQLSDPPEALWALIGPEQDGATVFLLRIGGGKSVIGGTWNFCLTAHAIERFYERGGRDLEAAMIEANRAVRRGELHRLQKKGDVWIAAAPGAFIGSVEAGGYANAGTLRARTWLHFDQLGEAQERRLAEDMTIADQLAALSAAAA
jgi:hypothetical protein